ncbi:MULTISPECIES: CBASS cGAMP synthase [Azospirillum]|uniref:Cyclic GMP-AMP synthase n=2 Tax=Azospirillum brasilense TaxID=192 RepID=A0ABU4P5R2_AZOBR|nr:MULTISPECIES: hypothetical protein [Azospirillum]MDW7557573.1 CBASS cGAMP synthase [Azospirillum brasilense]MDW7597251.1 CBASS cGAMP synthase [Azospirillum brasilense]MDW7632427.1 CBASS cGAMP synthase [Azospirillum brasilense]MDX5953062.1 CBASS cGAMP synthase [Azospirillum brasilense]OPH13106.1 hypothetical protein FE89_24010 [Azospirillum brasilense]
MANVSRLLNYTTEDVAYLSRLDLLREERALLVSARRDVRSHLKRVFAEADPARYGGPRVEPRFFTQGSYAYKTINRPAFAPLQQMDMDDGCYLPMSFIRRGRPSQVSEAFFTFVDNALQDLARVKGWHFEEKPTCCRLIISDSAHVDVPLYAIPDAEFMTLQKAARAAGLETATGSVMLHEAARQPSRDRWDLLPRDEVLLAVRGEDWKESDPRAVHDWFTRLVEERHGELLRRVCRYLKGWRDYNHEKIGAVTSILLMACAARAFEDALGDGAPVPSRDDQALAAVARRLPELLSGPVVNPAAPDQGEDLTERLDVMDIRGVAVTTARVLSAELDSAIDRCYDRQLAVDTVRRQFGPRVPNRPDLVGAVSEATAQVLSRPAVKTAAPAVGRSISG